ncbi:MAG: hypothetical protein NDF54_06805 [archaeon GB-1867-035]|nr:hypothetical protein [Candidatus Culexmicrobium profundum]
MNQSSVSIPSPLLLLKILKEHSGVIEGRKRFQKIVFLLKEKYGIPLKYSFLSYYYGPYSKELQRDLNILVRLGLIEEDFDGVMYTYKLTELGEKLLNKKAWNIDRKLERKLKDIVKYLEKIDTFKIVSEAKELMKSIEGSA